MSIVEGGLVTEVIPFPRGKGWIAIRAIWTGINWKPPLKVLIHHIRDDLFVGTWKVVGIEALSKFPREMIVVVEEDDSTYQISQGDILIFGRGAVSRYVAKSKSALPSTPIAVEIRNGEYKGILAPNPKWGTELILFHDVQDDINEKELSQATEHKKTYFFSCFYINTAIGRFTIEFKLSGKAVSAKSVVDILQPVRGFVIGASEELCLKIPRSRGRRAEKYTELFDPTITLKAASVRFRLHPSSSPDAVGLDTSKALRLLSQVLRAANDGDEAGVIGPLRENLKAVDESMRQIEAIVKVAIKQRLEFNATDSIASVFLGNKALYTIREAEKRKFTHRIIQGDIYGLDDNRLWCRISTSNMDPQQDWKLTFSADLKDKVRGQIPRRVEAEFETDVSEGVTQGNGMLLSIKNV